MLSDIFQLVLKLYCYCCRYEHSSGREAVLEMLHAIIKKFPQTKLDEQSDTLFVRLVVCLANDSNNKVRSMTATTIKLLIGRISPHLLQSILEYCRSWYLGKKQQLCSAGAQVKISASIINCTHKKVSYFSACVIDFTHKKVSFYCNFMIRDSCASLRCLFLVHASSL